MGSPSEEKPAGLWRPRAQWVRMTDLPMSMAAILETLWEKEGRSQPPSYGPKTFHTPYMGWRFSHSSIIAASSGAMNSAALSSDPGSTAASQLGMISLVSSFRIQK